MTGTWLHKTNVNESKGIYELHYNSIMGDFNTSHLSMGKSTRLKSSKERTEQKTLDQMELTEIYRSFHPPIEEYSFCSSAYETLSVIDHILGHRASHAMYLLSQWSESGN